MITGAAGVVLGVIMAAGGLIYYKRKHTGWCADTLIFTFFKTKL